MGTKNTSSGSQHTPRGVNQGISLVAHESGLPIDSTVDGAGKRRLCVDANVTVQNAVINVDLESDTDNVAIRNTSNDNELLIESDGSISIRLKDEVGNPFTLANPLPVEIAAGNLTVDLDAVVDDDSVRIYGVDAGTQRQVLVDSTGRIIVAQGTSPWVVSVSNFPATQPVSGTVTANQGTDPWNIKIDQTGSNNDVDVLTLPLVTLAAQANPFTTNLPVSVNNTPTVNQGTSPWIVGINQTGSNNDVDVLTLPSVVLASQANPFTTAIPVTLSSGGTEADEASDPSGDGLIALTGGADVIVSKAVSSGTYKITGFTWYADRQCTFRLEVRDGATLVEIVRTTQNSGSVPGDTTNFPTPIEIVGAATRVIRVTATRTSGANGSASAGINGFTV